MKEKRDRKRERGLERDGRKRHFFSFKFVIILIFYSGIPAEHCRIVAHGAAHALADQIWI